jgi:ABC-type Fe3+-hydroxamate transport system substrate-binding protein
MALKPDLVVLAPNRGSKFTYEKLKQLHIDSLVVPFDNLGDLIQAFTLIGDKIGLSKEARQAQAPLLAAVERVKLQTSEIKGKKVVFVNWHTPFIVAGENSLEDDLIHLAGGVNVAHKSRDRYPRWNMEALFEYDPDMIIDASRHGEAATLEVQRKAAREFWAPFKTLRAVKSGDIYIFKENVYSIAGPRTVRLIEAVNAMMKAKEGEKSEFYEQVQL